MSLLLDTHAWIWSMEDPNRLGPAARKALTDPGQKIFISTISTLELARLAQVGLITLSHPLTRWVGRSLDLLDAVTIEVSHAIAAEAYAIPEPFHKDPVDRLLAATARLHQLTLVTADARIIAYSHLATLDARA